MPKFRCVTKPSILAAVPSEVAEGLDSVGESFEVALATCAVCTTHQNSWKKMKKKSRKVPLLG